MLRYILFRLRTHLRQPLQAFYLWRCRRHFRRERPGAYWGFPLWQSAPSREEFERALTLGSRLGPR